MNVAHSFGRTLLAGLLVVGVNISTAHADELLSAKLRPCVKDGTTFGEVGSCGKVWKLGAGEAKLHADGKIKVEVRGLVLNDASTGDFNGTPDGVTHVVATLVCGGSNVAVVAMAERVVLSNPKGDAKIEAKLALPAQCIGPAILLREIYEGKIGGWLASTGF